MEWTSVVSVLIAGFALLISAFSNQRKNTKEDSTQVATMMAVLNGIKEDIHDIKRDLSEIRSSLQDHLERIVKIEQSLETAWKRIDELRGVDHGR